jgi:hypothetical protein
VAVIHFLGGAFVAGAPHLTYRWLLENLARHGYAIVATPFANTMNHTAIARQVYDQFNAAMAYLQPQAFHSRYLPVYGMGHSMGCKLHVLIGSYSKAERSGNILISYNNFSARRSIPLMEQVSPFIDQFKPFLGQFAVGADAAIATEFVPSPEETMRLVAEKYRIRRNLMVKFRRDDLDETRAITEALRLRFPEMTTVQILPGTHVTPMGQDVAWQPSQEFSPLDALGQFVKQGVYRDINTLKQTILLWLDPVSAGKQ